MLRRICIWKIKFLPWFGINSLGLLLFVVVDNGMLILIVVPWKENTEIFRYRPFFLSHNFLKLQPNCISYWIWVQNTYAGINSRDLHNTSFSFLVLWYLSDDVRQRIEHSFCRIYFNKLGTFYRVCLICFLTSHSLTVYLVRHHLNRS